jgi:hypothetical protein
MMSMHIRPEISMKKQFFLFAMPAKEKKRDG